MPDAIGSSDPGALRDAFLLSMRRLASAVTIITTGTRDKPLGMTASAVSSLSADPPSILVCVNRSASIHGALAMGNRFCVNLLGEEHADLSFLFGGKAAPEDRFNTGAWDYDHVPYLRDGQANLHCVVDLLVDYGSHSIVVGKVDAVRIGGPVRPLIYGDGRFIPAGAPASAA